VEFPTKSKQSLLAIPISLWSTGAGLFVLVSAFLFSLEDGGCVGALFVAAAVAVVLVGENKEGTLTLGAALIELVSMWGP